MQELLASYVLGDLTPEEVAEDIQDHVPEQDTMASEEVIGAESDDTTAIAEEPSHKEAIDVTSGVPAMSTDDDLVVDDKSDEIVDQDETVDLDAKVDSVSTSVAEDQNETTAETETSTADAVIEAPEESTLEYDEDDERSYAELQASADSEVIRAKLVKLEGIKVVGKIDLPPPPQPKEKTTEEASTPTRRESRYRDGRRKSKRRQPLTFKEKQEKEKKREERARVKQEKAEKAKKKRHYYDRMEQTGALKSMQQRQEKAKAVKNRTEDKPAATKSKNPVARLWNWLNGKYDNY